MSGRQDSTAQNTIDFVPDLKNGLSTQEAEKLRKKYGYNEITEKKANPLILLGKKFWGTTAWMLEVTAALTFVLQKYIDFYIIAALLIVNAVISFFQEERASRAVSILKQSLQVKCRVLRDGKWINEDAKTLVPGDVIRIRSGDFVPADSTIVDGYLDVDQSALTGESISVGRQKGEKIFSGSIIKKGESTAIVVATGAATYFGKTAELVQTASPKLHINEVVSSVLKWLLAIAVTLVLISLSIWIYRGLNILSILPLLLVLLIAAIPVALPAMFTVSMALGSMDLVKKGIIVTRLGSIEDAASMDILCTDKTGTITQNRLTVASVIPVNGYTENQVILYGAMASSDANNDAIDSAFLEEYRKRKLPPFSVEKFVPFDPSSRRTESDAMLEGKRFHIMKGAVKTIAALVNDTGNDAENRMKELAVKGYRTLAVSCSSDEKKGEIAGFVALYDPPRHDSRALIGELRDLGINVKMLTGDSEEIAMETARQVGLGLSITPLHSDITPETIEKNDGFSEIYPEDKYRIVKALQEMHHVTGMTGDGVNDAPALREAEVGIAVSTSTDVAKAAASAVLTKEGLENIVDLIKDGRAIYQRVVTWVLNKTARTIEIVVFVSLAFLILGNYIVSAFDIVLTLFLIDFVTISLSTDKVRWSSKPESWDITSLVKIAAVISAMMIVESFLWLFIGMRYLSVGNQVPMYSFSFGIILYFGIFTTFVTRERRHFWSSMPGKPLLIALLADIFVVMAIETFGIPGVASMPIWITLLTLSFTAFASLIINDGVKSILLRSIKLI